MHNKSHPLLEQGEAVFRTCLSPCRPSNVSWSIWRIWTSSSALSALRVDHHQHFGRTWPRSLGLRQLRAADDRASCWPAKSGRPLVFGPEIHLASPVVQTNARLTFVGRYTKCWNNKKQTNKQSFWLFFSLLVKIFLQILKEGPFRARFHEVSPHVGVFQCSTALDQLLGCFLHIIN